MTTSRLNDPGLANAAELERLLRSRGDALDGRVPDRAARAGARGCGCGLAKPTRDIAPPRLPPSPGPRRVCQALPLGDFRTNDNYIFLREILQAGQGGADPVEAGNCLRSWLVATLENHAMQPDGQWVGLSGQGVLVIDQLVELTEPIHIPPQMVISGVGINGAGRLRFSGLPPGVPAITFEAILDNPSYVAIQDIAIDYDAEDDHWNRPGIAISVVGDIVYLRRVSMRNWGLAVVNGSGFSVIVEQCDFRDNRVHIDVRTEGNAMRIRECRFTGSVGPAIMLNYPGDPDASETLPVDANTCLITGCTFVGNQYGVFVHRHYVATIVGNSFYGSSAAGIYVSESARMVRIISNYFGDDSFEFAETDDSVLVETRHHQWGFNVVSSAGLIGDALDRLEGVYVERVYARAYTTLV